MLFKEVIGQHKIKRRLISGVKNNKISHAQLFLGREGSGKLPLALAYAQYLNCTNRQADDACGQCNSCVKAQRLIHPDIHYTYPTIGTKVVSTHFIKEWRIAIKNNPYLNIFDWLQHIKAENKQGNITRNECNEIIKKLSLTAYEGNFKVLILWGAEYLAKEGNTLLKIIEEPPKNTVFLLIAENEQLILNTIISRTQLIPVPRLSDEDISQYVQQQYQLNQQDALQIALLSDGNLHTALKMIGNENTKNITDNMNAQLLQLWFTNILNLQAAYFLQLSENFAELGREAQKNFLYYTLLFIQQILYLKIVPNKTLMLNSEENRLAQAIIQQTNVMALEQLNTIINTAYANIERNANPRILFLNLTIQVSDIFAKYKVVA